MDLVPAQGRSPRRQLEQLLQSPASLDVTQLSGVSTSGWSNLHRAAKLGDANLVEGLLEANADTSARTRYGAGSCAARRASSCFMAASTPSVRASTSTAKSKSSSCGMNVP